MKQVDKIFGHPQNQFRRQHQPFMDRKEQPDIHSMSVDIYRRLTFSKQLISYVFWIITNKQVRNKTLDRILPKTHSQFSPWKLTYFLVFSFSGASYSRNFLQVPSATGDVSFRDNNILTHEYTPSPSVLSTLGPLVKVYTSRKTNKQTWNVLWNMQAEQTILFVFLGPNFFHLSFLHRSSKIPGT